VHITSDEEKALSLIGFGAASVRRWLAQERYRRTKRESKLRGAADLIRER